MEPIHPANKPRSSTSYKYLMTWKILRLLFPSTGEQTFLIFPKNQKLNLMDIQARIGGMTSHSFRSRNRNPFSSSSSSSHSSSLLKPLCSKKSSKENGDSGKNGDKFSTDWDKAWSSFRKQGKKSLFSGFSPDKYVSWNPKRSNYPLSEEVDPIKRTERSNLMLWTSPRFTLVGAIVIVTFLLVYTILAPVK